ncbi:DUF5719 family protein [Herbiconiux moechotypicola]|uniref:Large extracellular alpha-helical protein n=1 Tax=Herbiconiux moechotypicola TaxID=637393 RepID=A0ABP5QQW6_9MICO|nr:DUF5719 family protein [Herbiconiux moechotypicola]MCS5731036.1 DUF5719 family protein [Herbiconiux moechotypicola]
MAASPLRTATRVVVGVVTAAAAAGVVSAAVLLPLPGVTATPSSFTVDPAAAEEVRACPGPLVRLSDDSGQDATAISSVGSADQVATSGDSGLELELSTLASPDDSAGAAAASAPARVALPADAVSSGAVFAAAQSQSVSSGDLVGFAATACGEASDDSWLVAGSTTVGRTSFVSLTNPADVAAVVDVTVFGDTGAVEAPGGRNIDVPARSTRILSLAGLAPDLAAPVVHVEASVGAVVAAVQQSVVRGLEPGGVELVGATAPPATTQTVAGVEISGSSAIAPLLADSGNEDLQPVLRMFVPGDDPASVTVTVAEERTGGASTEYRVGLTPGIVTEFPLEDLPDGTYAVTADSDQPIVMAARTSTVADGASDFAWYPALQTLDETFAVATAPGPTARLHVVNGTGADVVLTVTADDGETQEVTFVPGTRSITLQSSTGYTVTSSEPVAAMVGYLGGGRSSAFALTPPAPPSAPLVVYP